MIKIKLNNSFISEHSYLLESLLIISEAIIHDVKKKYPGKEELVDYFSSVGPNRIPGNDKYLAWIMQHHEEADPQEMVATIRKFDRYGATLKRINPDLKSYKSFEQLQDAFEDMERPKKELEDEGAVLLYKSSETIKKPDNAEEIPHFEIIRPYNRPASCKIAGYRTEWCIAATKSLNYYNNYTSTGVVFYFIIDYSKPTRDPDSMFAYAMASLDAIDRAGGSNMLAGKDMEIYNAVDKLVDRDYVADSIGKENEEKFYQIMLAEREKRIPSEVILDIPKFIQDLKEEKQKAYKEKGLTQKGVIDEMSTRINNFFSHEFNISSYDLKGIQVDPKIVKKINRGLEQILSVPDTEIKTGCKNYVKSLLYDNDPIKLSPKLISMLNVDETKELIDLSTKIIKNTDDKDSIEELYYLLENAERKQESSSVASPEYAKQLIILKEKFLADGKHPDTLEKIRKVLKKIIFKSLQDSTVQIILDHYLTVAERSENDTLEAGVAFADLMLNRTVDLQDYKSKIFDSILKNQLLRAIFIKNLSIYVGYRLDQNNIEKYIKIFEIYNLNEKEGDVDPSYYRPIFASPYLTKENGKKLYFKLISDFKKFDVTRIFYYDSIRELYSDRFKLSVFERESLQEETFEFISGDPNSNKFASEKIEKITSDVITIFEESADVNTGVPFQDMLKDKTRRDQTRDNKIRTLSQHVITPLYAKLAKIFDNPFIITKQSIEKIVEFIDEVNKRDPYALTNSSNLRVAFFDNIIFRNEKAFKYLYFDSDILDKISPSTKFDFLHKAFIDGRVYTDEILDKLLEYYETKPADKMLVRVSLDINTLSMYQPSKVDKISYKILNFVDRKLKEVGIGQNKTDDKTIDIANEYLVQLYDGIHKSTYDSKILKIILDQIVKYKLDTINGELENMKKGLERDIENEKNFETLPTQPAPDEDYNYDLDEDLLAEQTEQEPPKPFYFNGRSFVYRFR